MFLAMWHYLWGYVMIKVSGFSTERFMNLAMLQDIYLWNIHPKGGSIELNVSIGDFKKLKDCSRKTRCKISIIKKVGVPFTLKRYQKRKFYSAGILVFVAALYVMSSFVWSVSVQGNERISSEEIIEFCKTEGLYEGQLKYKLDNKALTQKIIADFSEISWVAITTKGTDVTISVVETLPKVIIEDNTEASNIYSNKACIIESISVSKGKPMVAAGDVVDVGDLLVSGEFSIMDGDVEFGKSYTRSKADIKGKSVIVQENVVPLVYTEQAYTGKAKSDKSIVAGGLVFNLIAPNLEGLWEKGSETEQIFQAGGTQIPFKIVTSEYLEYEEISNQRTEEEAKVLLEEAVSGQRQELEFNEIQILEEKTEFYINNNEVRSKTVFTVIESIGVEENIKKTQEKEEHNE